MRGLVVLSDMSPDVGGGLPRAVRDVSNDPGPMCVKGVYDRMTRLVYVRSPPSNGTTHVCYEYLERVIAMTLRVPVRLEGRMAVSLPMDRAQQ